MRAWTQERRATQCRPRTRALSLSPQDKFRRCSTPPIGLSCPSDRDAEHTNDVRVARFGHRLPAHPPRVWLEARAVTLVRVECRLEDEPDSRIPVEHGLVGVVEVTVESVPAASLLLRSVGRLLSP